MATDGECVEGHRVEAFRRPVHGRGQSGGAGADHDEVEQGAGDGSERQAEVFGEFSGRCVAQHSRRRDDRRCVTGAQAHARQKHVGVGCLFEVDPLVGQVGTGGEGPQGHRIGRVVRPHDPDGARAVTGAQTLTPSGKGVEDHVGDAGLLAHEPTEILTWDPQDAPGLGDPARQVGPLARQEVQLPEEAPRAVAGDEDLAVVVLPNDLGPAFENDEEVVGDRPRSIQGVAGGDGLLVAELGQLRDLRGGQRRRHGVIAGPDDRKERRRIALSGVVAHGRLSARRFWEASSTPLIAAVAVSPAARTGSVLRNVWLRMNAPSSNEMKLSARSRASWGEMRSASNRAEAAAIHPSKTAAVASRSGSFVLATSSATVAIGQATAKSVDSSVRAAASKTAATLLTTSGASSQTASTRAWYRVPDALMAAVASSSLPPGKWW